MIRFDHVSKRFSGHDALRNITVEIKDGEFVFIIGPSGAGKTTFLRLLTRDLLSTRGDIYVNEWHVNTLSSSNVFLLRRMVGMVFQDFKLLDDRTVFENVSIGLEILGNSSQEITRGVNDILELVGLGDKRNVFPAQLSAGELQRAGIARAIIGGPKILLADEPTGNLDPANAWDILGILEEINKIGTTVIMTTHNVTIVNDLKKRTIQLDQGSMISDEEKGQYHMARKEKRKKKAP